ncbi:MAG: IGHMBP2 family helicase [Persicimonas sp.]
MSSVDEYVDRYRELVELEREEEMRRHREEIRRMSGRQRQLAGRAMLDMRGRDDGEDLSGHRVKFMKRRRGASLPDTSIAVGDLVMISKNSPYRDDNPTGTVAELSNHAITVAFDQKPHPICFGDGLRIDLYVNDITYQRQLEALGRLQHTEGRLAELRDILVGTKAAEAPEVATIDQWHSLRLNDSQREAVRRAMGAPDFFLVHGPPGTGKTTTAVEIIEQAVDRGDKVLACAASNTAVDTILQMLAPGPLEVVRVGHPARVTPLLREHTLDFKVEQRSTYQRAVELREEAFAIKDEQEAYTHPSGRYRRGMSNKKIKKLADKRRSARGVDVEIIEEMAAWIELQEEAEALFERHDRLRDETIAEVLEAADVICATNSTSGSSLLGERTFDLVVIDEATQATEPSCLVPIARADRVVMAGDHRQLPPVVQSLEADEKGLSLSLFERLAEREEERITSMLTTQYRMHERIMAFSNAQFYDGALEADASVREHTLADLGFEAGGDDTPLADALQPREPLVFVDTARIEAPESSRPRSTSRLNEREAAIVTELAESFIEGGVEAQQIAVIAPYHDQVELIRRKIDRAHLEVDTVDGFQGREKEVVVISLTRSNEEGEVGFLTDVRRFNVALTRARRKVVVVGDSDTVGEVDVYDAFIDDARRNGLYVAL